MTDTLTRDWEAALEDRDEEIASLRRALADAELRAMKAAQCEDFAQFTLETTRRRADRAETALRTLLTEYVIAPHVPADTVDAVVGSLVDDIGAGATLAELDLTGASHAEYGPDGFTPSNCEVPF